jgi:hypothetical protein
MTGSVKSDLKEGQMFRGDISHAIAACALRMDGYRYMETVYPELCIEGFPNFHALATPVTETLTLHPDPNNNFAVFFRLNRSFHFGGEHLTKYRQEHVAYDHLFLAL